MSIATIAQELDQSRRHGALTQIVIPPCPDLLQRLKLALKDSDPDLNEIARIASSDVAMAAALLRTANSPVHLADGPPCASVGQAMTRLGLDETARIMTGFILRNALPVNNPHMARFWERSTMRAQACETIAHQLPGCAADLAYTFGLFCQVGMPVLLQCVRGYGATIVEANARIDRPYIATENANHRTDHAVVGALLARAWGLANELVAAIRLHHDLQSLGDESIEPEVHTLIATGLVAEHLMRRHEAMPEDADWADNHERAMRWLQIDHSDLQYWEEQLSETFAADA